MRIALGHTGRSVFEPPPLLLWVFLMAFHISLILLLIVGGLLPWMLPFRWAFVWLLAQVLKLLVSRATGRSD